MRRTAERVTGRAIALGLFVGAVALHFNVGGARAAPADPVVLLTADGEGHVAAYTSCPSPRGLGGLDRRATIVSQERADMAASAGGRLLVDAGNWLVGPESVASRGEAVVAAYTALEYDAVHVTPKDLYWGKDHTLALLRKGSFPSVSANLVEESSGNPLVAPFIVKDVGGVKVAITGVSEPPAGLEYRPRDAAAAFGCRRQVRESPRRRGSRDRCKYRSQ